MNLRNPTKMGDGKMVDTMLLDGLMDAFNNYHMGMTIIHALAGGLYIWFFKRHV